MTVFSMASAKGGCGKTSLAILVGMEFALDGAKVALLDCDLNQHAAAFAEKATLSGFEVLPDINEHSVLKALRSAKDRCDIVIVDLPGGSSALSLKAMQRSDFVVVPTQPSLPDARDAMKTIAQIEDAQELADHDIPRALAWTRFLSGFESTVARHVRESMEGEDVPILKTALMERAAFRAIHLTGTVPRQTDPKSPAARNVTQLTNELWQLVSLEQVIA